jgi:2-keto-3-deoxy-L-rhamnonate aldolase RhmA
MTAELDGPHLVPNRMKEKLAAGESVFGVWIDSMRTPAIVRIAAAAGVDYVFIDMEHSSLSHETVGDMCEMARACGVTPVVRPFTTDIASVGRLLDIGAQGIMYPDVQRLEEVLTARDSCFYPPVGRRGHTTASTAQDFQSGRGDEIKKAVNDETLVAIQIESRRGIDELEALLKPGVVGFIEIGRGDLSTDLGHPGETRHPETLAAVDQVIATATKHGVPVGTLCSRLDDAEDMLRRGTRSVVFPNERNQLLGMYTETMGALHELAGRA